MYSEEMIEWPLLQVMPRLQLRYNTASDVNVTINFLLFSCNEATATN